MELENYKGKFSSNDPINIVIPDSLGATTYEFLPTF